jgi:hypothetical protein
MGKPTRADTDGYDPKVPLDACLDMGCGYNRMSGIELHLLSLTDNDELAQVVTRKQIRPSTQVD